MVMMKPASSVATEAPMDCTAELIPMNVPRKCGTLAEVMMAMPGTKRPLTKTKKGVVMHSTPHHGTLLTWVIASIGNIANTATILNTRALPYLSERWPIHGDVKKVKAPPDRYSVGNKFSEKLRLSVLYSVM